MKKLQFLLTALLIVVAGALSSCSKSAHDELTSNIPANSKVVVKLNIKQILDNSGGRVENGKIVLPEKLASLASVTGQTENVNKLLSCLDGIDIEEIYFVYARRFYMLSLISDSKALDESLLAAGFERENDNGFIKYDLKGLHLFSDGKLLWGIDHTNQIQEVRDELKNGNIGQVPALNSFLSSNNAIDYVVNVKAIGEGLNFGDASWAIGSFKFQNQEMLGELVVTDADGKRKNFGDALGEIDTDFLRYVPQDGNVTVVFAMGNIEESGLRSLMGMAAGQMGPLSDLLTALNGTIGGAIQYNITPELYEACLQNNFDAAINSLKDSKGIIMAHYPQSTIENSLRFIRGSLAASNMPSEKFGENGFSTVVPIDHNNSVTLYAGNADGNLAVANYPFSANGQNSFASHFTGRRAAIYSYAAPNEISRRYGCDYSGESCIWLESDCVKMDCRFLNTDKNFLEIYVDLFTNPQFLSDISKAIQNAERNNNYYDYYDYEDDDMGCFEYIPIDSIPEPEPAVAE